MAQTGVVDSHVHFWDLLQLSYAWLDAHPSIRRTYLPRDFDSLITNVLSAAVFVEANGVAGESDREVAFVEGLADADPRIAGIVAYVDLLDEPTRRGALERFSARPRVVGVRQNIQGHSPGFSTRAAFVRGVREVGEYGLVFDLCVTAGQLNEVIELVESCPDTQFVLDHCGKPAIRADGFDSWARDVDRLAPYSNVACKLSGLLTEAREDQRSDDALYPYAAHVHSCFGASRLLYGSDWPVVNLGGGLAIWRAFLDRFTASWSDADQRRFYADNAIRLYGLTVPADV